MSIDGDFQIWAKGERFFGTDLFEVRGTRWELAALSPGGIVSSQVYSGVSRN